MSNIYLENYEERDGAYFKNGKKITNFTAKVKKIIMPDDDSVQFLFEVCIDGKSYTQKVPFDKICRTKFLQDLPVVIEEELFYKDFAKIVQEMDFSANDILYQTNQNGIQKVNGEWIFVFTNGSITANGFNSKIYSDVQGAYIPPEAVVDMNKNKETVKKLFQEYNRNPYVFYPIFLLNLMAIASKYFRIIGETEFMKLTIWLDGCSGSGKTELAKAVGTYTYADEALNSNLVSVTGKRNYVMESLCKSSGRIFVLDDVKREMVRERKNSVHNIVDDCLRSVFQGKMTDVFDRQSTPQMIDTCALVTGEYIGTEESQNARLMYLNVDGFLKSKKDSETLRVLQKNPIWLTITCCGYAQWLLGKMEDDNFHQLLVDKLEEIRCNPKEYGDIGNAARLNENEHMLEMAGTMAEMYFKEIGLTNEFIGKFHTYTILSIEESVIKLLPC